MKQEKSKSPSRFDEWDEIVDCNDCQHYYDNTCDGVSKGSTRLCKQFKAVRGINMPEEIKSLQNGLKSLVESDRRVWAAQIIVDIGLVIHLIVELIGG
jgi:hypothetical protein